MSRLGRNLSLFLGDFWAPVPTTLGEMLAGLRLFRSVVSSRRHKVCDCLVDFSWSVWPGADPGGGGFLGVRTPPPPPPLPFGGPPKSIKREKTTRTCPRKRRVSGLNSYPDPPFPKSCIRPWLPGLLSTVVKAHMWWEYKDMK